MAKRVNVRDRVKMEQLTGKTPQMELSEAETINFKILVEKSQQLQAEFNQVQKAIAGLVGQIITSRGLNPKKFGVNLAAGRILPLEPIVLSTPNKDGKDPLLNP